jgi:single-strand DNA-binding protein
MASYNRVILMGNLTRDPELKTLPDSETQVCDFALAINRRWKNADGVEGEEVLFIDCAAFGKSGQTIAETLSKGRPLHVEGRLRFEQWTQEDGQRRSKHRVIVEQFRFVDRKPGSGKPDKRDARPKRRASGKNAKAARPVEAEPVGVGDELPI